MDGREVIDVFLPYVEVSHHYHYDRDVASVTVFADDSCRMQEIRKTFCLCNTKTARATLSTFVYCMIVELSYQYMQKLLSPKGALYMVLVQENKPKDITRILSKYGLHSEVYVFDLYGPCCLEVRSEQFF